MKIILVVFASSLLATTALAQTVTPEYARELAKGGNLLKAVEVIDEVIQTSPPMSSYYRDKANYLLELEEYEQAIKALTIGIGVMPDSVSLYDMRGTLMEAFGLYREAISDFTAGYDKASVNSLKSHLMSNRGGTKIRVRDYKGAYDDLIAAIKFDSTNIDALNNLAAVCDEVGRSSETFKYLEKVISLNPGYVPAYVNMGFAHQRHEQHDHAIHYFDQAIEIDPDEPLAYSNRSFSKLKTKDVAGAMKDINHSIKLMSSNSYAYKIRALIRIENGMVNEACEDLRSALELGYAAQYGSEVEELIDKHCKH